MKQITYEKVALKTLARMPNKTAKRIVAKVEAYASRPSSQSNNVKILSGSDALIRLRVGNWRVIMHETEVIAVLKIGSRGDIYKD